MRRSRAKFCFARLQSAQRKDAEEMRVASDARVTEKSQRIIDAHNFRSAPLFSHLYALIGTFARRNKAKHVTFG